MSLEITSKRPLRHLAEQLGHLPAEPLQVAQVAAADRDADHADLRRQPGQQRQLHLDGVLLAMGRRVQLQPGNSRRQSPGQIGVGGDLHAGQGPVACGATAQSAPPG